MINSEILQVTLFVTDTLDQLQVPYVIGGSIASIFHGIVRTTMDADIVANLEAKHVKLFVAAVQEQFYIDEQALIQAIQRRSSVNLIHLETMFKIDIFIPKERPFDQQQLARRIPERIQAKTDKIIWILSAEDVVLAKLDWFRLGGEVSERQWRDILGVLKLQHATLDIAYLQQWAQALQVTDLLEHALGSVEKQS
ncbi:hypothetical protein MNBD_CHLOROFLEXI01-1475 [hydrothermal vent metagenome]|uniref:Uncharacterized protein n=1 Tax=hydrothermal vent metagenome TaxID=652676 RepID=A0A3B0VAQ1_9ZZZZ